MADDPDEKAIEEEVKAAATASLQRPDAEEMHAGLVRSIGTVHSLGLAVQLANALWQSAKRPEPFPDMRPAFPGRPGATVLTSRVALKARPGAGTKMSHMEAFIPMMADLLVLAMAMCSS